MLPDQVSNTGPLTYESGALPIALRGPAAERDLYPDPRLDRPQLCCYLDRHFLDIDYLKIHSFF